MKLPMRPIFSVLLLIGGFICLAVGLVSFKQLQITAPETLPKNAIATNPTLPPPSVTPTVILPQIGVKLISASANSTQIVLASDESVLASGLSLRLRAPTQLAAAATPYTLSPGLNKAGWSTPVNSLTLAESESFFDLALIALEPGGIELSPKQIIATLPVSVTKLSLDSELSRLVSGAGLTYQLIQITE